MSVETPAEIAAEQVANWLSTGITTREAAQTLGMTHLNPNWNDVFRRILGEVERMYASSERQGQYPQQERLAA